MIREAVLSDIPALLGMGERFAAKAQLDRHVGYDPASVEATLAHLITHADGICLISDDGAAGGLCHPHPFNHAVKVGQELFWWSEGREGAALFDALENAARDRGAQHWTMITLEALRPKAIGKLYQRRGYVPLEHSYIKGL